MIKRLSLLAALVIAQNASAAFALLFDGSHAAGQQCVAAIVGGSLVAPAGTAIFVDSTQNTEGAGHANTTPAFFLTEMPSTSQTNYQVPFNSSTSDTSSNHAPYLFGSASLGGPFALSQTDDLINYTSVVNQGVLNPWAYDPTVGGGSAWTSTAYPPVDLPNVTTCTSNSAANFGQEFCMGGVTGNPPTNLGGTACRENPSTDSPSDSTSQFSQLLAAFYYVHNVVGSQAFNLFDIRQAFAQTSSNYATGYNSSAGGYGVVNYNFSGSGAASLTSPSQVFLRGPGMLLNDHGFYTTVNLYPFKTTRRSFEVVYVFTSKPTFAVKNEYTTSDITALGGTLIFTGSGASGPVAPTVNYLPTSSGTFWFAAFTADGLGNYSRGESFTAQSATMATAVICPCHG